MKIIKTSKLLHRWLMLFVGVQCIIWSVTGLYMVALDIHYIHGDDQIINHQNSLDISAVNYPLTALIQHYPNAENIILSQVAGKPQFTFNTRGKRFAVSAMNGELLAPISKQKAEYIAQDHYAGDAVIEKSLLITENPPFELRASVLPAWRVDFADNEFTTLYISEATGDLVGKRHQYWRIFDWMFRLHVMDYDDGENVQNLLLFILASLALCAAISGSVLTYFKVITPFFKRKKQVSQQQPSGKLLKKRSTSFTSAAKKQHQWLSLMVGVQVLIWLISGLFFNVMDLDKSSGLAFYKKPITEHKLDVTQLVAIQDVLRKSVEESNKTNVEAELMYLLNMPVYKVTHAKGLYAHFYNDYSLFDAYTGENIIIDESMAGKLALDTYAGTAKINEVSLLKPPIDDFLKQQNNTWKISFADALNTAVYIETGSGRFVGHSNEDKRFVDLFFTLHFMDYTKSGGFNHWLIVLTACFTLWFIYSGILLILHAIKLNRFKC